MKHHYKGFVIFARKRHGLPFHYALIYRGRCGTAVLGRVERDEEGLDEKGIVQCAQWEIDQGYFK